MEERYSYDDAVDYIESQGVSCNPGDCQGDYVCNELDWGGDDETESGEPIYFKSTLDEIIKGAKEIEIDDED